MKRMGSLLMTLVLVFSLVSFAAAETAAGDVIPFGSWPQTADGGEAPIEWLVLEVRDGKALLLSLYALDTLPYHDNWEPVSWDECSLRAWLNGEFFAKAFSAEEQAAVVETTVTTAVPDWKAVASADWGEYFDEADWEDWEEDYDVLTGGSPCADKVFLLSSEEVEKYFPEKADRVCVLTDYAVAKGCFVSDDEQKDGKPVGFWWLRSPGLSQDSAGDVIDDGSRSFSGIIGEGEAVRPALWLDLSAI